MGHLEGREGDNNAGGAPQVRAADVVTTTEQQSVINQLRTGTQSDSATLAQQGTIPRGSDVIDETAAAQAGTRRTEASPKGGQDLNDILPSMDWKAIRDHAQSGTPFKYEDYQKVSGEANITLTADDRKNSIMYKMETGEVDGSKIFKNVKELIGRSDSGGASLQSTEMRTGTQTERQQVNPRTRSLETPTQPDQSGRAGEQVRPGEQTRPGEQQRPGDQQPPPYKFDRLQMKPDGSGNVDVKKGDTMWGIAAETLKHGHPPGYKPSNKEILDAVNRIARENPQIKNRDVIKPGDHIKIPKDLIKEIPEPRPRQEGPQLRVENRGASPEFAARLQREVDNLPPGVRRLLEANGTKIVAGDKISGVYPDLANVRPRGWPPGSTWDNADGMYNSADKTVVATEHRVDNGRTVPADRMEGVGKHEIGHAVDHAMGNFSQSEEFKQAYDRDVANLSPADRQKYEYLLQAGDAGRSEAFAEVFGAINGSTANPSETADTLAKFPNLAELLRRKQAAL